MPTQQYIHCNVAAFLESSVLNQSPNIFQKESLIICGSSGTPVGMWTCPHQVLAATLTLSQPGCRIMPTLYWRPHQVLKATGAPAPNLIVVLI